jgi:prephenate dehydratase
LLLAKPTSDGGVMAIENSIAGSILPNYNLLQKSNLKVTGEVYLHIKQNLMVNPGVKTGGYQGSAFSYHGLAAML